MNLNETLSWESINQTIMYLAERNVKINKLKCIDQYKNLKRYVENNPEIQEKSLNNKWVDFFWKSTMRNSVLNF